eukprot:4112694-Ditylum_brightwellii.AAC.1
MVALSQIQLICCSVFLYLEEVTKNWTYVAAHYLGSIRTFLQDCNAKVVITDAWKLILQRTRDVFLTDVLNTAKPGNATLTQLNMVWLYLGVVTLADIVNGRGTMIEAWVFNGSRRLCTTIPWPNQGMPPLTAWQMWHRFLKWFFATTSAWNYLLHCPLALDQPLSH